MKCHVCGKGPKDGTSIFRQTEKGKPAVWACQVHTTKPNDGPMSRLIAIIESQGQRKH